MSNTLEFPTDVVSQFTIHESWIYGSWRPVRLFPPARRWYEPAYTVYPSNPVERLSWTPGHAMSYVGSNRARSFASKELSQ